MLGKSLGNASWILGRSPVIGTQQTLNKKPASAGERDGGELLATSLPATNMDRFAVH